MDRYKSLWKGRNDAFWSFYCPLCKAARRLPGTPRPRARHFVQIGLTAMVFTLLAWEWLSWKGMVSYLPLWAAFETMYRLRLRAAVSCPHCGFDPYLYLTDVGRARQEIEDHWRKKFSEKGIPFPEKAVPPAPPPQA